MVLGCSTALSIFLFSLAVYLFVTANELIFVEEQTKFLYNSLLQLTVDSSFMVKTSIAIILSAIALLIHSGLLISVLCMHAPTFMVRDTLVTLFAEELDLEYSTVTQFETTNNWLEVAPSATTGFAMVEEHMPTPLPIPEGQQADPKAKAKTKKTEKPPKKLGPKKKKKRKRSIQPAYYVPRIAK